MIPTELRLEKSRRVLVVAFDDGQVFELPCEYLRVFSPSAEVRGHGPGEPKLVTGRREVNIQQIEPIGQYAVALHFDDGHRSGLFSWDTLYRLGRDREANWARYLERMAEAGLSREPGAQS